MLRHTRRFSAVHPKSWVALPLHFRSPVDTRPHQRDGRLYQFVIEYDHGKPMPEHLATEYRANYFATAPCSGSIVGGLTTVAGVSLFTLCFGYLVARPVVEAHRELFSDRGTRAEDEEQHSDAMRPVEEEGDEM